MKIYLIGMPGSGKSTTGKQLADALGLSFVDLDAEIVAKTGKAITDVFSQDGEEHFRKIESEVLQSWAFSSNDFVMATGGGAPCFYNGIEVIKKTGLSIFLDVQVHEIIRRVRQEHHRPLLQEADREKKLDELRNKRLSIYQQAHICFTGEAALESMVAKIKEHAAH